MFLASIKNNTGQVFITFRELNDVKKALINSKIYGLFGIIFDYLNKDAKRNMQQGFLREHCFSYEDAGRLSAIDRTASNYNDAKEKV